MSRLSRWSALLIIIAVPALSGCTQHTPGAQPASAPPGTPTAGTGTPAAGTGTPGPVSPSTTPPAATAGYPADAGGYAQSAVAAWAAGDQARLDQLRAPASQIFQTLSAGNYERHFGLYQCTGAAGSSICVFYNGAGDELDLQLRNQLLGQPHAVTGGQLHPTTFPADDQAYAQEALDAWLTHNAARLALLASTDAVTHSTAIAASHRGEAWHYDHREGAAGSTYLVWRNNAGDGIAFRFVNPGIAPSSGPQHRIADIVFQPHP